MVSTTHQTSSRDTVEQACQLHKAGLACYAEGQSREAACLFRRALRLLERAAEPDSPDVANVLGDLAAIYEERCEYTQAGQCYQRAVEMMERIEGYDEVERLRLRLWHGLSRINQWQGHYEPAEALLKRALNHAGQVFGQDEMEVVEALNGLGRLYKDLGRFTDAGQAYQRALVLAEQATEAAPIMLATLYHNLGGLEHAARNYERGEPFARRAVELREQTLGAEHPAVAADLAALAALLDGQKRYRAAEAIYRRALTIFERVYGAEHYEVAVNLNNLAANYQAQGKREGTEQLYRRALQIKEKIFGADHPDVAFTLNNLAALYKTTKRYAEAEELYQRALKIFEQVLGPEHPHVPVCLDNYAQLLRRMKRTEEARKLEAQAKQIRSGLNLLTEDDVAVTSIINPQFTRFALAVRASGIHRQGVFAEERIPSRRTVIEYTGERISRREAKRSSDSRAMVYLYRINKYWALDGAVGGSGAEYFNHSCAPNLRTRIINGRIYYRSRRQIEPGEELTIDYNFSPDIKKVTCRCGGPKCRGTINRRKKPSARSQSAAGK